MEQLQTSRTLNSARICVDVSFVRTKIYDGYDDLVGAASLNQIASTLTKLFAKYDIAFTCSKEWYDMRHSQSYKTVGIVEGETVHTGGITIVLWREILHVVHDDDDLERFIRLLTAVIRHELVHREQVNRSNAKSQYQELKKSVQKLDVNGQYYGDPHEHLAMAHEMVENFRQHKLTPSTILQLLALPYSEKLARISVRYHEIFELWCIDKTFDPNRKMVRRLKKQMYQVLCN